VSQLRVTVDGTLHSDRDSAIAGADGGGEWKVRGTFAESSGKGCGEVPIDSALDGPSTVPGVMPHVWKVFYDFFVNLQPYVAISNSFPQE